MLEILERITEGTGTMADIDLLEELAGKIKEGSLCGLGQTAPNPVLTTLKYFRHEYEEHVLEGKCRAGVCSNLVKYQIDESKCVGCTLCVKVCPVNAITGELKQPHQINRDQCIGCGQCAQTCRVDAITQS